MIRKIKVEIEKPCNQNWKQFPKAYSNGKLAGYCHSCDKSVIDFTHWSEESLKAYFKSMPSHVCGRFKRTQLKCYDLQDTHRKPYLRLLSMVLTGFLLFSARLAEGQKVQQQTELSAQKGKRQNKIESPPVQSVRTVRGIVLDSYDKTSLPGVNVIQKGSNNCTITMADGTFDLILNNPKQFETLIFTFIGLTTQEITIDTTIEQSPEVFMDMEVVMLGEVTGGISYRTISPRRWWRNLKLLVGGY